MKTQTYEFLKLMAVDAAAFNANMQHYGLLDGIRNKIQEAWEIWPDADTKEFWGQQLKPAHYTADFAHNWIDNEDFEADGYNEKELDNLFGN